jgi:hypothetical protein
MAVTVVARKINRGGTWTFETNATNTFTDPILVKGGDSVYWNIEAGINGTYQLQSAPVGTDDWSPTPFNGGLDLTTGGIAVGYSGSFTAPADCLFRIALTAWTSGSATIQIRK